MDQLFVEIQIEKDSNKVCTTVNSFLAIYVYKYLDSPANINVNYVRTTIVPPNEKVFINVAILDGIDLLESTSDPINDLRLPSYIKDSNTYISGVCSVCREIVSRNGLSDRRDLLGFKESCLLSPAENSIWTRFCEVDVITDLNRVLHLSYAPPTANYIIPDIIPRLEAHMNEPVRMHNIYKQAREEANKKVSNSKNKIRIECSTPKETLSLLHSFAEGISFTIADLLLYPCFKLALQNLPSEFDWQSHFPLVYSWLNEVESHDPNCHELFINIIENHIVRQSNSGASFIINECERTSLYKADPKRYKPRNRIYTDQNEIEASLDKLSLLDIPFSINSEIYYDNPFDWESVDPGHIENSALPAVRLQRKKEQLENLANAVISLAKDNDRIIDFCSGTGHLGILLALKLPKCQIIILENKAISIERAKKRTEELKLTNCLFYQCNIDYFKGFFNIGTSLHACGTATDIVLEQCLRSSANFVTCPCCYGSIRPMPHILYPLSKQFRSVVGEKDYLHIAHAADQAHQLGTVNCKPETTFQGQLCMAIIDTDRKYHAENAGYNVILTRLKPENCTPKNHLLVGTIKREIVVPG